MKRDARKIYKIDIETERIQDEYPSVNSAERLYGRNIWRVLNGMRFSAYGWHWAYADEIDPEDGDNNY